MQMLVRAIVLNGMLAVFAATGAGAQPLPSSAPAWAGSAPVRPAEPPLPGKSGVSKLEVTKRPDGRWFVQVTYFYTGEPAEAAVRVYQDAVGAATVDGDVGGTLVAYYRAHRGTHSHEVELRNPGRGAAVTTQVFAGFGIGMGGPLSVRVTQPVNIVWQDPLVLEVETALQAGEPQKIVDKAVGLIDGNRLDVARTLLQALVERQPAAEAAYIELARIAMKSSWNAAGLRNAESLLQSALKLKPDSVNAKILLGYVYTHQERYKEAEPLFADAAASNPRNLWLWANWGELLYKQDKMPQALAKYKQAIARPPTGDTYDRARIEAYRYVLYLQERNGDLVGLEATHKQRVKDYPTLECFSVEYASFLVRERADDSAALAQLRDVPSLKCPAYQTHEVQGLAYYLRWSRAQGDAKIPLLVQARTFMPAGARVIYFLASTERLFPVAQQLLATGENVDSEGSDQFTALGWTLRNRNVAAARRLIRLGAKPMAPQGPERVPAALIPVFQQDEPGIRLMQASGVDYSTMRYGDRSLLDAIRQSGDKKLLELLQGKSGGV